MQLPADGREYATWTITADTPGLTFEVEFDGDDTWTALEPADGSWRLLVAGPDATGDDALTLPAGRHLARIRCTDNPEIVIRDAGLIDVR